MNKWSVKSKMKQTYEDCSITKALVSVSKWSPLLRFPRPSRSNNSFSTRLLRKRQWIPCIDALQVKSKEVQTPKLTTWLTIIAYRATTWQKTFCSRRKTVKVSNHRVCLEREQVRPPQSKITISKLDRLGKKATSHHQEEFSKMHQISHLSTTWRGRMPAMRSIRPTLKAQAGAMVTLISTTMGLSMLRCQITKQKRLTKNLAQKVPLR